jgi:hypothetical protein
VDGGEINTFFFQDTLPLDSRQLCLTLLFLAFNFYFLLLLLVRCFFCILMAYLGCGFALFNEIVITYICV